MTDPVFAQLDYLAGTLTQLEERMIDPREFGRLEGAVDALKDELGAVKIKQAQIGEKLDLVLEKLTEAKGGWKLLMAFGGAAAALSAVLSWFASHTFTIGPR